MSLHRTFALRPLLSGLLLALAWPGASPAADPAPDLAALQDQNRELRQLVESQQRQIDDLRRRLDALPPPAADTPAPAPAFTLRAAREVRLSGEVGVGLFDSGANGFMPNAEFRVDTAKLFVEAPVWKNVYVYSELDLTTREAAEADTYMGETYVEVEDLWSAGRDASLSLRAGRLNLPFGEEYQRRGVMEDPLVTHSLADIWGIDEGAQVYGAAGRWRYNVALLNGSHQAFRDFNRDKSVVARLSFDPRPNVRLSASALRTGKLDQAGDVTSEAWFANAFFRSIGPAATTRTFGAELAEIDAAWSGAAGRLAATAGWGSYTDDNTAARDDRAFNYQSVEGVVQFTPEFYAAARYSRLRVPLGYPLAGLGNAGRYFYSPAAPLTTDLDRVSVGLGYRFGPPLVWKVEYTWENGRLVTGVKRADEDLFASLLGISF